MVGGQGARGACRRGRGRRDARAPQGEREKEEVVGAEDRSSPAPPSPPGERVGGPGASPRPLVGPGGSPGGPGRPVGGPGSSPGGPGRPLGPPGGSPGGPSRPLGGSALMLGGELASYDEVKVSPACSSSSTLV